MLITLLQLPELRKTLVKKEKLLPPPPPGAGVTERHVATLKNASLWWVSRDMTKLALDTAPDLPPWTPTIAAPETSGLMWFDHPIGTTPADPGEGFMADGRWAESILGSAAVHGVHWSITGDLLNFTFYGAVSDPVQRARTAPLWRDVYEIAMYTVRGDVEYSPQVTQLREPWAAHVVHTIGAAWLLMQQPRGAETRSQRASLHTGSKKGKPGKVSMVQVIDLRRLAHNDAEREQAYGGSREFHTRWMVRGHWRQQRVGPGRRYTRPVFVSPYLKGPEGAPIKTDRVNAWRH